MKNYLMKKTRNGEVSLGVYLSESNPMMLELAVRAGFDYVRIDCEHTMVDINMLKCMLQTADALDTRRS
jgi:2-keto-3-deoxy-L-rhamnonate aldolase RhmA